ncbi:MAG: fibronectin type III domain-containing protein [Planctomycetota bacterium]
MKPCIFLFMSLLSASLCIADTTPPTAPSGLAAAKGIQLIILNWADNQEGDLAGYNVYRSFTSGGGYDLLDSDIGDSGYLDDTAVSGTTYYYVVTAVDTSFNESAYSSEISARPFATKGGAGMLALGECDCPGILFGGSGVEDILTILNGGMHINSYNFDEALDIVGRLPLTIDTEYIDIVGGFDYKHDIPEGLAVHELLDSEAVLPDPYEYMPDAVYSNIPDLGTIADSDDPQTYSPGYYSGGIQISSSEVHLEPGDYYLDSIGEGASIHMSGGLLTGEGVTLHIIGDADEGIDVRGNVSIDISAPTSGNYEGIAIFQKRDVNYDCVQSCVEPLSAAVPISEFSGSGIISIEGAVYMPHNRLELGGTGDIFTERVVADRIYINGTLEIVIDYQGDRSILGDFVHGGPVDIDDLIYFVDWWLVDYDVLADLNYDHRVDLADFAIIAENWSPFY